MKLKLWNVVIFAENYEDLVKWYQNVFNLKIITCENDEYHYTELGVENEVFIGITPSEEINHEAGNPRNNSCVMQLKVSEIKTLFEKVKIEGGTILFGPSLEEKSKFFYGAINDIEGNQIWLFEDEKKS